MARPLRLEFPGALYHLTARGNARGDIFFDQADRDRFLQYLKAEIRQQRWLCYAWCLMNNHYHLLIETPEETLARGMRRLNGRYTQSFNRRHARVGHLFQGRYKSIVVDKEEYLLELSRYIVLNPVRVGLVKHAEDWPWSSFRATVGIETAPEWLARTRLLKHFGKSAGAYRDFVQAGIGKASPWENVRGQIWLGSSDFLEDMQQRVSHMNGNNVPDLQKTPVRPDAGAVLASTAKQFGCTVSAILARRNRPAYHLAACLLRREANLSLKETAQLFGVSPSRISHIQRQNDMESEQ